VLFGAPADTGFALPGELPAAERVVELGSLLANASHDASANASTFPGTNGMAMTRADVRAAEAAAAAARADMRRAQATWLPRLNAMARYEWHSPDSPWSGRNNWTVGVMASWTPFGVAQLGDAGAAAGREQAARAQAEAGRAQAELEIAMRANAWEVALERLRIVGNAVAQSAEAHRIVAKKYEGGLASVVELLGAAAAETEAKLRLSNARHEAIVRAAERVQSVGGDPAVLAAWADS
jgi:outer membrane protein TolC